MENHSLTNEKLVVNNGRGHTRSLCSRMWQKVKASILGNLLLVLTLVGVFLGFAMGFGVRKTHPSETALMWIGLPGQLYLRLLKMMIVPLIVCSVICGHYYKLLVTIAAMAIPSVASASIMTTIMILTSMNIPVDDIALLLAVEWYLDRIRSTSSVVSHTFCAASVDSLCKGQLAAMDRKNRLVHDDVTLTIDSNDLEMDVKGGKNIVKNSGDVQFTNC